MANNLGSGPMGEGPSLEQNRPLILRFARTSTNSQIMVEQRWGQVFSTLKKDAEVMTTPYIAIVQGHANGPLVAARPKAIIVQSKPKESHIEFENYVRDGGTVIFIGETLTPKGLDDLARPLGVHTWRGTKDDKMRPRKVVLRSRLSLPAERCVSTALVRDVPAIDQWYSTRQGSSVGITNVGQGKIGFIGDTIPPNDGTTLRILKKMCGLEPLASPIAAAGSVADGIPVPAGTPIATNSPLAGVTSSVGFAHGAGDMNWTSSNNAGVVANYSTPGPLAGTSSNNMTRSPTNNNEASAQLLGPGAIEGTPGNMTETSFHNNDFFGEHPGPRSNRSARRYN